MVKPTLYGIMNDEDGFCFTLSRNKATSNLIYGLVCEISGRKYPRSPLTNEKSISKSDTHIVYREGATSIDVFSGKVEFFY